MVMIDVIRHYCPLTLAKDQMHHICFWALLDSISTQTTPHRPRECFYLEHRSLSLEVMHWILGTKFWIQVILRPISESARAFTPGLSSKWPRDLFSEHMNKTWSCGQLVHLHVFNAHQRAGWNNECWKYIFRLENRAGPVHSTIFHFGGRRSLRFPNSNLAFQVFIKVYLSKWKDRIYFISQSVNLIFNF